MKQLLRIFDRFKQGYKQNQLSLYWKVFKELGVKYRRRFLRDFYIDTEAFDETRFESNRKTLQGLHSLLSSDNKIRFSCVIEGNNEATKRSVENQTAANLEIVKTNPSGTHVLFVHAGDRLRLDLLYRYEQILRVVNDPNAVLYISPTPLKPNENFLSARLTPKFKELHFPYEFEALHLSGLLVPIKFYNEIKTLNPYERAFKLDLLGARFIGVQAPLYGQLSAPEIPALLPIFTRYYQEKGLNWEVEQGLTSTSIKAIPQLDHIPHIQVIMPYKDQKKLTLDAIQALLKQTDVKLDIWAVDNNSEDKSIADELRKLNVHVLEVNEPFNYSRLNNLAAKKSKAPYISFVNNDAILASNAVYEMVRWASQARIGCVGSLLTYPNGLVQHGGVKLDQEEALENQMNWIHMDCLSPLPSMNKKLQIVDAVTAAASIMKREHFEAIGGFDEVAYPIAYSDTRLACQLKNKGLLSLFTPYATGVHHESISRKDKAIEDFDRSVFLHEFVAKYKP